HHLPPLSHAYVHHRDLPSFPTRRSSDLIARRFHTVILVGIPKLGPENRNEAARFVTLIDALYEHRVKLLAAADAEPQHLYEAGEDRKSTRLNSSHVEISYAVFCLKKKKN